MQPSRHHDNPFEARFRLMIESRQVSRSTLDQVMALVWRIEGDYGVRLTEANAGMFVTHIALALQRLADGQALEDSPPVVLREARALAARWAYSQELARWLAQRTGKALPEGEIGYLTIHLERLVRGM